MESPLPNEVPGAQAVPPWRSRPQSSACVRLHPGPYQPSDSARKSVWECVREFRRMCACGWKTEREEETSKRAFTDCGSASFPQSSAAIYEMALRIHKRALYIRRQIDPVQGLYFSTKVKWANQMSKSKEPIIIFSSVEVRSFLLSCFKYLQKYT